jgi:hypothetical protein
MKSRGTNCTITTRMPYEDIHEGNVELQELFSREIGISRDERKQAKIVWKPSLIAYLEAPHSFW